MNETGHEKKIFMAKKKKSGGLVYSTGNIQSDEGRGEGQTSAGAQKQKLRVWLERKGGGKVITVVRGHMGSPAQLKDLGSALKSLCGVGGTAKEGEIMVQGDHRDKVVNYLINQGHEAKKAGG